MKQIHKIYRKSAIEFAMLYNKVDRSNAQLYSNYELSEILHEATGNRYQIINDMKIQNNRKTATEHFCSKVIMLMIDGQAS